MNLQIIDSLYIELDSFSGPMDLLLHLIDKNEIDIMDIPIAILTDQYIETLEQSKVFDMDGASEFIDMAATLLLMKARALLPSLEPDEDEMTKEELERRLLEYKTFKEAAGLLEEKSSGHLGHFYKEEDPITKEILSSKPPIHTEELLEDLSLQKLNTLFIDLMKRKSLRVDRIRKDFSKVTRDLFTIKEQSQFILRQLEKQPRLQFSHLFSINSQKEELIVTFLSLLELTKRREVFIKQEATCSEIEIIKT